MCLEPTAKAEENSVPRSWQKIYDVAAPAEGAVDVPGCPYHHHRKPALGWSRHCEQGLTGRCRTGGRDLAGELSRSVVSPGDHSASMKS